ncbi:uncharacterized protein EI90DRAFT_2936214, partial [Cantharellus anzutake]|uniref:uncharacterized protein n=1 Tax=Cantharellus anzutake TaxID=1750568 RepID=UPI0019062937
DSLCNWKKNKKPQHALSNGMWLGNMHSVLKHLTIPEQMLITLIYLCSFVFKMHPLTCGGHNPTMLQRGMRGNVTSYDMDMKEIMAMVEGKKMPWLTRVLASIIMVTYVGQDQLPMQWLKSTFRVWHHNVLQALQWLIHYNPLYRDVEIDESILASLHNDDIPIEIQAGMRHKPDEVGLDECQGTTPRSP